jgi:carbonic anhydrase
MKTHTSETQATITPAKALEILKEGNQRFVNNLRVNRNLLQQANETRDGQWPFATIVSCIDSRTSTELIFDQGLGDIFSVRIAGTVINTDVVGSLEFACKIAGSRLIVVLGHTSCGAIKGACDHIELGNLTELLSKIQPAVYEESQTLDVTARNSRNSLFVENVTDLNVRRSVRTIVNRSYILEHLVEEGKVAIIGAKHDLASGRVDFFADTWVAPRRGCRGAQKPHASQRQSCGPRQGASSGVCVRVPGAQEDRPRQPGPIARRSGGAACSPSACFSGCPSSGRSSSVCFRRRRLCSCVGSRCLPEAPRVFRPSVSCSASTSSSRRCSSPSRSRGVPGRVSPTRLASTACR